MQICVQSIAGGTAEGTSVRMISKEALLDMDVPVPSMARQRRIVDVARLAQREQALMAGIAAQRKRLAEGILMRYARKGSK